MKSINLTKALRAHIVSELVMKATKTEREAIQKEVYRISQEYWKAWDDQWLTESTLTTRQMNTMLTKGLLQRVTSDSISIPAKEEVYNLGPTHLRLFLPNSYNGYKRVQLELQSESVHPSFYHTEFECPAEIRDKATAIVERTIAAAEQAKDLRGNLAALADSCRTSKQLLEVLPQAKEFLPAGSTTNGLISTKLIEDVQAKLKTGVPA